MIYELMGKYQQLFNMMDDCEIEDQTFEDTLESLDDEMDVVVDYMAKMIQNGNAYVEMLKKEEDRLKARRINSENRVKKSKAFLQQLMDLRGRPKVDTGIFKVWTQNSPKSLQIEDESLVPAMFIKTVEVKSVKKKELMKAIEAGEVEVPGTKITQGRNLRIR